ncbi:hypothetical protein P3T23_004529 [Paraburkholderia sp. GAS448]|uniref:hypothetical protein n=1 Tax=Paraburkholderia sp. GAS448 TaxID=3035136 RepID=UPI003D198A4B
MTGRNLQPRLTHEQVQALGALTRQPELFTALESIFVDLHHAVGQDYDAAKNALVFAEGARGTAQIAHGKLLVLADILDLFNRQKV